MNLMIRRTVAPLLVLLLVMLSLVLGGATAAFAQGGVTEVTMELSDSGVTMPEEVEAGLAAFTLNNGTMGPGGVTIARLNDGITLDAFMAAAAENPNAMFGLVAMMGGPGGVNPHGSQRVVIDLAEGTYVVLNMTAQNPIAATFEAVAGEGEAAEAPVADATLTLKDFGFELPTDIQAGAQVWNVINEGPQPHEIVLFKLAPGATAEDVLGFLGSAEPAGPPPFSGAGGTGGMATGVNNWVTLNLEAGDYLALCFIPDPATGQPHFMLGMQATFTVPGEVEAASAPQTMPTTGAAPLGGSILPLIGWGSILVLAGLTVRGWRIRRETLRARTD